MNPTQAPNKASNQAPTKFNGIDVTELAAKVEAIGQDPALGMLGFEVETVWQGQTRSETRVSRFTVGGEALDRNFTIRADEPLELLGSDFAPNPQELILAALNACMMVGYVAGASVQGIELESVKIITAGDLDLRGFLGLDENVAAGYEGLTYTVQIKGNGTPEQFEAIHENVKRTSPNYFNITRPIALNAKLEIV